MNESNLRLSNVQQKAIKALAKADARPVKQMLAMVLHEGFIWTFNQFSENNTPYLGWPDDWKEISEELEKEYKKDFSSNLEISGVPVENIPTEIKFRNSITENKRDNSVVHIHITYIRSLINVISLINNSKIDEDTGNKFDRQFNLNFLPKEDREKGIEIIESIKQIQTETTNIDFSLINSQIEKINSFLDNLTMYNSLHSSDGTIKQIFVNNPFSMEILTSSIIIYLYDVIIDSEVDEEPQTIQLVIKLFEYLLYIIDINSITDENIMTIIKKYRADENLNRLKRFNKKSDELQNTHKIKRKFNLGYLDDEDPEEEFNEIISHMIIPPHEPNLQKIKWSDKPWDFENWYRENNKKK